MSGSPTVPEGAAPRRPLKTRQRAWAQALARMLTRAGVAPNAISMASLVFAVAAGLCLAWTSRAEGLARAMFFLAAAACIQIRLLCNMLDGLVAVEGGKRTVFGEIFNDMPDRLPTSRSWLERATRSPGTAGVTNWDGWRRRWR